MTVKTRKEKTYFFSNCVLTTGSSIPAPGRLFMTNYGVRIADDQVEFGAMIECSQAEDMEEDAEVFRPKLIRDLQESLGLFSVIDLCYEGRKLSDQGTRKKYENLLRSEQRNMPVVLIEKKSKAAEIAEKMAVKSIFEPEVKLNIDIQDLPGGMNQIISDTNCRQIADRWARSLCGIAYVFLEENGKENRITITDKAGLTVELFREEKLTADNEKHIFKKVMSEVGGYSKRMDDFHYGNVIFINEAGIIKNEIDFNKAQSKEDFASENGALKKTVARLEEALTQSEQKIRDLYSTLQQEKKEREDDNHRLGIKLNMLEKEKEEIKKLLSDAEYKLSAREYEIKRHRAREKRPKDIGNFIKWVENYYPADICLLPRAKNELKKAKNYDLGMLCDGIEVLSEAYKKMRTGEISEQECRELCIGLTKSSFNISLCGEASIKRYPEDYSVIYEACQGGPQEKRILDMHLKSGVDSRNLLRIYFFWDQDKNVVVVGSMPDHLRSVDK